MSADVELFLKNPEALVRIARDIRDEIATAVFDSNLSPCFFIWIATNGCISWSRRKVELNKEQGALLGTLTWRSVKQELALRGVLLRDLADELIDAFSVVGMRVVLVTPKALDGPVV